MILVSPRCFLWLIMSQNHLSKCDIRAVPTQTLPQQTLITVFLEFVYCNFNLFLSVSSLVLLKRLMCFISELLKDKFTVSERVTLISSAGLICLGVNGNDYLTCCVKGTTFLLFYWTVRYSPWVVTLMTAVTWMLWSTTPLRRTPGGRV